MGRASPWFVVGVMLLWAGAADADSNRLLHGDYAFTGEATCLVSLTGFNTDLTPIGGRFVESSSVQGVWTFNGDGTGTRTGRDVSVIHPDADSTTPTFAEGGGAASSDFQASFTYNVTSGNTFTTTLSAPLTGTVLTGPRAGQTFTVDQIDLAGLISQDRRSLTLAPSVPAIETVTFFPGGDVHYRICHRSRVLFLLQKGN